MKTLLRSWIVRGLALMMAASVAFAQDRVPFRQEELDQMLAPIALYPDPLLSQVLMASTYPLEVVQASRWSRANPNLKGQDAVRAVEPMDWDPSVKSLTAFPQVLAMMDQKLEWTEKLGEAFLAQQEDVMDSVQALRRKADAQGNLLSSDQMSVARQGGYIYLSPPAPEVVYIPYYDPMVVYGPWWYPAYPPVFWAPPAYYVGPAYRPGFYWGSGISISATFFFGHTDWRQRRVTVVRNQVTNVTVNRTTVINPPASRTRVAWQHDPVHRRGAPFHNAAARQRFEQVRASAPAAAAAPVPRSTVRPSSDATRQRKTEERRNGPQERRDSAAPRAVAPSVNSGRPSASSDVERSKPAVRRQAQGNQANTQAQRPAPQAAERKVERREAARPQPRTVEPPRPATAAPQAQRAPQPAPQRAETRGSGNHGPAAQHSPGGNGASSAAKGAPRQKAPPRENGDQQNGDRGRRRGDG